jgi:hypothetical protein
MCKVQKKDGKFFPARVNDASVNIVSNSKKSRRYSVDIFQVRNILVIYLALFSYEKFPSVSCPN